MALLLLLHACQPEFEWRLTVAHVHHGLRGAEADEDACFVEAWARRLELPFVLLPVTVTPGHGRSLEMAARDVRRSALLDLAQADDARVVLAHQAEDQAETLVMRMIRGTGVGGLAGMRPVTGRLVRPLLDYRRQELEQYLRDIDVPWRQDSTNQSRAMTRNRIRAEVLPILRTFNPRVEEALERLARSAAELDDWASAEARRWYGGHLRRDVLAGEVRLAGLRGMSPALAARALRLAAQDLGFSVTEEQLDRALKGSTVWPRHHTVEWQDRDVVITEPFDPPVWPERPIPVQFTGVTELPLGHLTVRTPAGAERGAVPGPSGLFVRPWRAGDRIRVPSKGLKKLQDLFVDAKVPRRLRHAWPVIVTDPEGDQVVAVPGLAVAVAPDGEAAGVVVEWHQRPGS
jgi:tRNA(Ile)-lysidine synthase